VHRLPAAEMRNRERSNRAVYVHANLYIGQVASRKKITFVNNSNNQIKAKLFFLRACAIARTVCTTPSRMSPHQDIRRKANGEPTALKQQEPLAHGLMSAAVSRTVGTIKLLTELTQVAALRASARSFHFRWPGNPSFVSECGRRIQSGCAACRYRPSPATQIAA
jgi:hypothetical protein